LRSLTNVCVQGQLAFPFVDAPEGAAPVVSRYRRRLQRVAGQAYRLGVMRGARGKRQVSKPPRALSAAVVMPRGIAGAHLDREDRNELTILAARVAKLSISRVDPEKFFIDRDEISAALRELAKR
jgi:hypothetical protein